MHAPQHFSPVVVGDRWGFADQSGKLVINPQFERAEPFASGLAEVAARQMGLRECFGQVDRDPQFDKAGPFSSGLAAVEVGGRYGYVNPEGKICHQPAIRRRPEPSTEGCAAVKLNTVLASLTRPARLSSTRQFEDAAAFSEELGGHRIRWPFWLY